MDSIAGVLIYALMLVSLYILLPAVFLR